MVRVVVAFVLCLTLVGCIKATPRVAIPSGDTTPPTVIWQLYNVQTKERRDIVQDKQIIDVPTNEQDLVTLTVEDLESGVREVTLSGSVDYKCEQGGQVEAKKYNLPSQLQTAAPDHENKVPIKASLVHVEELNKHGCKENQTFGGGTVSLEGKGTNFVNGAQTKTIRLNLKK